VKQNKLCDVGIQLKYKISAHQLTPLC